MFDGLIAIYEYGKVKIGVKYKELVMCRSCIYAKEEIKKDNEIILRCFLNGEGKKVCRDDYCSKGEKDLPNTEEEYRKWTTEE